DQQQGDEHRQAEQQYVQAGPGDRQHRVDGQGAADPFRRADRPGQRAEQGAHRLPQDQADAEGGQQGFQRSAVEKTYDAALDGDAHQPGDQEGRGDGDQQAPLDEVGKQDLDSPGGIGAEHDQLAVGHVDHAHDAEGNGQADGRQQQDGAQARAEGEVLDEAVDADATGDGPQRRLGRLAQFGRGIRVAGQRGQGVARLLLQRAMQG